MSFNKITAYGHLGRDPELRITPQGNAVCSFTMATTEKGYNGKEDITTWFRITLWGKQAENAAKYLSKGSPVYIEGRLRVEEGKDKDGKDRHTLEVHATDMQFIGSNDAGASEGKAKSAKAGGGAGDNSLTEEELSDNVETHSGTPADDADGIPF